MDIDEEFEKFIEFPGESKEYVTSTSAKLFAEYCVTKHETATREVDVESECPCHVWEQIEKLLRDGRLLIVHFCVICGRVDSEIDI